MPEFYIKTTVKENNFTLFTGLLTYCTSYSPDVFVHEPVGTRFEEGFFYGTDFIRCQFFKVLNRHKILNRHKVVNSHKVVNGHKVENRHKVLNSRKVENGHKVLNRHKVQTQSCKLSQSCKQTKF